MRYFSHTAQLIVTFIRISFIVPLLLKAQPADSVITRELYPLLLERSVQFKACTAWYCLQYDSFPKSIDSLEAASWDMPYVFSRKYIEEFKTTDSVTYLFRFKLESDSLIPLNDSLGIRSVLIEYAENVTDVESGVQLTLLNGNFEINSRPLIIKNCTIQVPRDTMFFSKARKKRLTISNPYPEGSPEHFIIERLEYLKNGDYINYLGEFDPEEVRKMQESLRPLFNPNYSSELRTKILGTEFGGSFDSLNIVNIMLNKLIPAENTGYFAFIPGDSTGVKILGAIRDGSTIYVMIKLRVLFQGKYKETTTNEKLIQKDGKFFRPLNPTAKNLLDLFVKNSLKSLEDELKAPEEKAEDKD